MYMKSYIGSYKSILVVHPMHVNTLNPYIMKYLFDVCKKSFVDCYKVKFNNSDASVLVQRCIKTNFQLWNNFY